MTIYDITQINRIKKYIIKLKWLEKVFLAFFEWNITEGFLN